MLAMADHELVAATSRRLNLGAEDFRTFYRAALPRVYGYLLRRCGSVSVAEDLTQETFLAAVVALRTERQIDDPLPWIVGIARHKLVDHYRRSRGTRPFEAVVAEEPVSAPDDSDGRAISALAAVPEDQRIALILRHVDGLSVPEVAAALGRSIEAVESLLARGRVGFRRAYSGVAP